MSRDELQDYWPDMFIKWQCRTKVVEFRVYCSRKNEWSSERSVSFQVMCVSIRNRRLAYQSEAILYWKTLAEAVLSYNSESEPAELISAPAGSTGLDAKSMHCSANVEFLCIEGEIG